MQPKDVIDSSNDTSFTNLVAYCSKGKLDKAKYWCHMVIDEILCNPPTKSRVQYHCNNCNENGHIESRCSKICMLCRPSCGHLIKECPKRREEREKAKSKKYIIHISNNIKLNEHRYFSRVSELLKNPLPKQKKEYGWSLLQLAAYCGHFDVVKWLVEEKGSDIDKISQDGCTALMCAARSGHFEICAYFLEKGTTSVFNVDHALETALTYAVSNGHREVVRLLAQEGGPIELKGREKIGVRNKEPITTMFQLGGRFIGHHADV